MSESFGQKVRRTLDKPLTKKGFFFWFLSPLLFFLSFIVAFIAKNRRIKGYLKLNEINPNIEIKVICIGNILLGGSGKSPIVQKIALTYLENGYNVAIASRGIGKNIKPYYYCSEIKNSVTPLSDENREHYEILTRLRIKGTNAFYILQNKNRLSSLKFLYTDLEKNLWKKNKTILILDDGLQHFQCPRNYNICLWSPFLLLESPQFSMPIGPYREGFGIKSFQKLLNSFDFRFWSRIQEGSSTQDYKKKIEKSLHLFSLKPNKKDIIVSYKIIFWSINFENNSLSLNKIIPELEAKEKLINSQTPYLISGIAHPKQFILDISNVTGKKNIQYHLLNDHSELTNSIFHAVDKADTIIITLKDLFRWSNNIQFVSIIKHKNIIACSVDIHFLSYTMEPIPIIHLLT